MSDSKDNKIILKTDTLPGVDLSILDLELVSSVKVGITKITKPIYKVGTKAYIGVKEKLDNGDVIQVGNLALKYKVLKHHKMDSKYWNIYQIKRIDGAFVTSLDMEATKVGKKVKIVSRQTFEQIFNWACSLREENLIPTTVCENEPLPCESCDTTSSITQPVVPTTPPVEPNPLPCKRYSLQIAGSGHNYQLQFTDCDNSPQEYSGLIGESGKCFSFCSTSDPILNFTGGLTQDGLIGDVYTLSYLDGCSGSSFFNVPQNPVLSGCATVLVVIKEEGSGNIETVNCDGEVYLTPYNVVTAPTTYKVCRQIGADLTLTGPQAFSVAQENCNC